MAAAKVSTREKVYLVEHYLDEIKGSKLPSNKQVLAFFLNVHRKQKKTVLVAATLTVESIAELWNRATIPIRHKQDCIKKVQGLFAKWRALKKNAGRRSEKQCGKEEEFTRAFEDLFDIAHALQMIIIEEDRQFLIAQRQPGRRGAMTSVDVTLHKKEQRKRKRSDGEIKRRATAEKTEEEMQMQSMADLESSTSASSTEEDVEIVDEFANPIAGPSNTPGPVKRGRKQVLSHDLAATLDRTKVSDRSALMIVAETARSLGQDIRPMSLNRSTIRRQRQLHRKATSNEIKDQFDPKFPLIVHWDGKLLPDLTGTKKVDRLPVLVTSNGESQLLAVPKLPSGTGEAQAQAVFDVLKDWGVDAKVQGMCFDTTSSNTGRHKGACIILEQLLGRTLLYIGCRHHVLELVAGAAYSEVMGASSAPDVLLFKRFKARWDWIDHTSFEDSSTDAYTSDAIADIKDDMVKKLESSVTVTQPRDDYRELMELAIIFLGGVPPRGIRFSAPGAMHQARWMSKSIYTFKVWLFRSQFKLTTSEHRGLRELCIFFSRIYVQAWATAPSAVNAPRNDLLLLQQLQQYKSIHSGISNATLKKMIGHLWFLSEELVALALFDDNVDVFIKDKIVAANRHEHRRWRRGATQACHSGPWNASKQDTS